MASVGTGAPQTSSRGRTAALSSSSSPAQRISIPETAISRRSGSGPVPEELITQVCFLGTLLSCKPLVSSCG